MDEETKSCPRAGERQYQWMETLGPDQIRGQRCNTLLSISEKLSPLLKGVKDWLQLPPKP